MVDWGNAINLPIEHGPNYTSNGCTLMGVDWGDKLKLNYTSYGCMLMEVDWGDKLKLNYTAYGCMLMEIDWGGKFNCTSC